MENKLMLSLYEDEKIGLNMEMVFDIITLYGDKNIDGIEFNSYNLDRLKKCAKMCRKNNFLFRCHFPLKKLNESETKKYLNCLNDISKELRYKINVVFHSTTEQETMEEKIEATKEYINNILKFVDKYNINVIVSIENLNYNHGTRRINIDKIDNILSEYDKLKFTYDIGHDLYDNKIPANLSKLQIEKINNVHIHSVVKKEDHHMIEKDSIDFEQIKQAMNNLKSINYTNPIVLEYAIDYLPGSRIEEKIINLVKSFAKFREYFMKKLV